MRLINKKNLILLTSILLVITTILVFKQTKPVELDEVKLLEASNNTSFAMYVGKNNIYEEYQSNKFPSGHNLNLEKSKCLDVNGSELKDVLSYEDNQVKLTSNKTAYCYLYFDEKVNLSNVCNGSNMQECVSNKKEELVTIENLSTELKGNMYRYQGLATDVDNNYICFGTNNKENCINDTDHYMYRIIGIEESGRIKVIKKEALNNFYQWYTDYISDIKLPDSVFFQAINGNDFLDNLDYITSEWKDKISDNDWLYGEISEDEAGAMQIGVGIYKTESGQKPANWYLWSTQEEGEPYEVQWEGNEVYLPGTTLYFKEASGEWTDTIKSKKISLIYLHDYSYSVGDEAKCSYYHGKEEYSKCRLGWMHLSNNDPGAPSEYEWTMLRSGWSVWGGSIYAFRVDDGGYTRTSNSTASYSVRPVFYIDYNQIIESGLGTIDDPYIIK